MPIATTRLRVALAEAGSTQTELAQAAGIERTRFSRIVNGLNAPDEDKVAIAAALGRTVEELWPVVVPLHGVEGADTAPSDASTAEKAA